jgi:hypothetical protein
VHMFAPNPFPQSTRGVIKIGYSLIKFHGDFLVKRGTLARD